MQGPSRIGGDLWPFVRLTSDCPEDVFHMVEDDLAVCESPTFNPRLVDCVSGEYRPLTREENDAWVFWRQLPASSLTRRAKKTEGTKE